MKHILCRTGVYMLNWCVFTLAMIRVTHDHCLWSFVATKAFWNFRMQYLYVQKVQRFFPGCAHCSRTPHSSKDDPWRPPEARCYYHFRLCEHAARPNMHLPVSAKPPEYRYGGTPRSITDTIGTNNFVPFSFMFQAFSLRQRVRVYCKHSGSARQRISRPFLVKWLPKD